MAAAELACNTLCGFPSSSSSLFDCKLLLDGAFGPQSVQCVGDKVNHVSFVGGRCLPLVAKRMTNTDAVIMGKNE